MSHKVILQLKKTWNIASKAPVPIGCKITSFIQNIFFSVPKNKQSLRLRVLVWVNYWILMNYCFTINIVRFECMMFTQTSWDSDHCLFCTPQRLHYHTDWNGWLACTGQLFGTLNKYMASGQMNNGICVPWLIFFTPEAIT